MNYQDVLTQITTLPSTYKRSGALFDQLTASFAFGISRYTDSADALQLNSNIQTIDNLWLNLVGLIAGISRNNNETLDQYRARIIAVIGEPQGPPVAIEEYLKTLGINSTYADKFNGMGDFSTVGYDLYITTPVIDYNQLAESIDRVRPAGVPFSLYSLSGGFYADTINFIDAVFVTGSYVENSYNNFDYSISSTTNNFVSNIPTRYLTDPVINSSLA